MTDAHADRNPLGMTPGEKLATEWEARHDAPARGPHGNRAAVQDYLRQVRSTEHASSAVPAGPPAVPAGPPAELPPRSSRLRRLAFWHR